MKRKLKNQTKPNAQLFAEYFDLVATTRSASYAAESKRLLTKFWNSIGEFPPSHELAIKFLTQYQQRKINTRARYAYILSAFFTWYCGEKLPIRIKTPKILPQVTPKADFDRIIAAMRGRKSHRQKIERDVLLIETGMMTGLRAGELASLKVGDLHLDGADPVLLVRGGKGGKDRAVPLVPYLTDKLKSFTAGKDPTASVFGLVRKSISMHIKNWAVKAGVPHIHAHSMRHYAGTTLAQRGANPRIIQSILGHESLDVTMRYLHVTGQEIKDTMRLLGPDYGGPPSPSDAEDIMPVVYSKEPKKGKVP